MPALVTGIQQPNGTFRAGLGAHIVEVAAGPTVDVVGDQQQALPVEQLLAAGVVPLHQLLDGVDLQPQCLLPQRAWDLLQ